MNSCKKSLQSVTEYVSINWDVPVCPGFNTNAQSSILECTCMDIDTKSQFEATARAIQ